MEKQRNLSLKKTFILYVTVILIGTFPLSAVIVHHVTVFQQQIWNKYIDQEVYYQAQEEEGADYLTSIRRPQAGVMSERDEFLSELCDFFETYTVLILSLIHI